MKIRTKIIITVFLIVSLLFFPSPEQNFLFYFPTLILNMLIIIKMWKKNE